MLHRDVLGPRPFPLRHFPLSAPALEGCEHALRQNFIPGGTEMDVVVPNFIAVRRQSPVEVSKHAPIGVGPGERGQLRVDEVDFVRESSHTPGSRAGRVTWLTFPGLWPAVNRREGNHHRKGSTGLGCPVHVFKSVVHLKRAKTRSIP